MSRLLKLVNPEIVVVEEAAEVLESQLIVTLGSNVKHLIMIGDHKQLPPQAIRYISLFLPSLFFGWGGLEKNSWKEAKRNLPEMINM